MLGKRESGCMRQGTTPTWPAMVGLHLAHCYHHLHGCLLLFIYAVFLRLSHELTIQGREWVTFTIRSYLHTGPSECRSCTGSFQACRVSVPNQFLRVHDASAAVQKQDQHHQGYGSVHSKFTVTAILLQPVWALQTQHSFVKFVRMEHFSPVYFEFLSSWTFASSQYLDCCLLEQFEIVFWFGVTRHMSLWSF